MHYHRPVPAKPAVKPISAVRVPASVTLADVARIAGVSKITASRALANPGVVSPDTQQRVRDAVAHTGYVPNLLAGALRSNRTRLIACLVPTIGSGSVFLDAVQAMTEAFGAAGYQVMLGQRGYDVAREEGLVDAVIARRPDGVVLMAAARSPRARARLAAAGMPVVEAWDMAAEPVDMVVGFSHRKVGAAIARFLHAKGRRRLAMITSDEPNGAARAAGFVDAARRLGLVRPGQALSRFTFPAPSRMRHGREGLRDLLHRDPGVDAVYCANDMVALGAMTEARALGLNVPHDLAIVGFGDVDFAADAEPALTTVHVDSAAIGRQAAEMIMARIEGRFASERVRDLGFRLVERGSA